jgi:hypothetical protein
MTTSEQQAAEARLAYARLFSDNSRHGDGMIVLADIAIEAGFYQVPSLSKWISDTGSAAGFDLFCAEQNGRRALFSYISRFASLNESEMLRLERIARFGFAEE